MNAEQELSDDLAEWIAHSSLAITPQAAHLTTFEDALEQQGWKVTLILPAPERATWDVKSLYATQSAVARYVDGKAAELDAVLPGTTLVTVTMDGDNSQRALDDAPEEGEGIPVSIRDRRVS